MAVGDKFRLSAVWHREGRDDVCVNQWWFEQLDALVLDTPEEDLLQAFKLQVEAAYADLATNFIVLFKYSIFSYQSQGTVLEDFPTPIVGGQTGDPMPANIAPLVSWRTALFSRRGRSRTFLPPANEAANTNGRVSTAYQTIMANFRDAILDDIAVATLNHAGWGLQVFSPADTAFYPVLAGVVRDKWSSQRDRRNLY